MLTDGQVDYRVDTDVVDCVADSPGPKISERVTVWVIGGAAVKLDLCEAIEPGINGLVIASVYLWSSLTQVTFSVTVATFESACQSLVW